LIAGRPAKPPPRSAKVAPAIAAGGSILGVPALAFGLPGALVVWAFWLVAAWVAPPAILTGKKNTRGYPTAAHSGEAAAMQRYRFWVDLKWSLPTARGVAEIGWPSWRAGDRDGWRPGGSVYASWAVGVLAAAIVS
jgi:hypothetical protein